MSPAGVNLGASWGEDRQKGPEHLCLEDRDEGSEGSLLSEGRIAVAEPQEAPMLGGDGASWQVRPAFASLSMHTSALVLPDVSVQIWRTPAQSSSAQILMDSAVG